MDGLAKFFAFGTVTVVCLLTVNPALAGIVAVCIVIAAVVVASG